MLALRTSLSRLIVLILRRPQSTEPSVSVHPRYEPCSILSANGIPNVVWLDDALAALRNDIGVSDNLYPLVPDSREAANLLLSRGYQYQQRTDSGGRLNGANQDCYRDGIRLELSESSNQTTAKVGLVLIDAATWKYDLEAAAAQTRLGAPAPPLDKFISSFLEYWLLIQPDEYKENILWSLMVANFIYRAYDSPGPNREVVRNPEFAQHLKPELRELHFDLTGSYPGQSPISSYRKHEYHALRYRQILDGTFTARPYPTGNFPISLAEFPELTGMNDEPKPMMLLTNKTKSTRAHRNRKKSKTSKRMTDTEGPLGLATAAVPGLSQDVQLQVVSDLHLNTPRFMPMYRDFAIIPRCPYLALLGDIGSVHDGELFRFLISQLLQFEIVFYVLGNHEPYPPAEGWDPVRNGATATYTYENSVSIMEKFEADNLAARDFQQRERRHSTEETQVEELGRFVFLNRRRFDLTERVSILGATLFSRISEEQRGTASLFVSDFSNITGWNVDRHNAAHASDLAWLNNEVRAVGRENEAQDGANQTSGLDTTQPRSRSIVVLTHHSPMYLPEANDPEHLEDRRDVQTAFATDLSTEPCWTSPDVKLWAFGHTHFNCDLVDEGGEGAARKRVVANQRGYGREDTFDFDPDKVITVG